MKTDKYGKYYSEKGFWEKLAGSAKKAGIKLVYMCLLLFYALQSPKLPKKSKAIIIGALGYLILPLDLVPDFIPVAGFTDDLGALGFALAQVAMSIDADVRIKAKKRLIAMFGEAALSSRYVIDVDAEVDKNTDVQLVPTAKS